MSATQVVGERRGIVITVLILIGALVVLMLDSIGGGAATAQTRPVDPREDPLVGFHYEVEIPGVVDGYFTEAYGMGSENDIILQKIVTEKGVEQERKVPGRLQWGDIVLTRGITSNMELWTWRDMVEDGDIASARHHGSLVMFNQDLSEVARWNFENAWPSKLLKTIDSDGAVVEELTIAVESIERVN